MLLVNPGRQIFLSRSHGINSRRSTTLLSNGCVPPIVSDPSLFRAIYPPSTQLRKNVRGGKGALLTSRTPSHHARISPTPPLFLMKQEIPPLRSTPYPSKRSPGSKPLMPSRDILPRRPKTIRANPHPHLQASLTISPNLPLTPSHNFHVH